MRYADRKIRSVAQLMGVLKQQRTSNKIVWHRGHGRSDWNLVPSLARIPAHLTAENALIKRFKQNAIPHLAAPSLTEWEWMFLMQHHRAHTRLLDWTESPLAALYFAVRNSNRLESEGAVWCLDPIALNKEAHFEFIFETEVPAFGHDKELDSYLPSRLTIDTKSQLYPLAIVGPRNTPRMAAQLGTFTINHTLHDPIEEIGKADHVWKWVIPADAKNGISKELPHLGISRLTLFPDLDSVAELSMELLP